MSSLPQSHKQIDQESNTAIVLARRIAPIDLNPNGVIHGGQILELAEEAGHIAATKYCCNNNINSKEMLQANNNLGKAAYLASLNHMDFLQPIFVNEVMQARAEIIFTSQHSLAVEVEVTAENIGVSDRRVTNRGLFWYVNFNKDQHTHQVMIAKVPPLLHYDNHKQHKCSQLYNQQKENRQTGNDFFSIATKNKLPEDIDAYRMETKPKIKHSVAASRSVLAHMVFPSDCYEINYATGGTLMKLMDTVAGIAGLRHSKNKIATISVNDINFHSPVKMGKIIMVIGTITFTSNNLMEVLTQAIAEDIYTGERRLVSAALFNYAILDKTRKVPPLVLTNDHEKLLFEKGKERYENRKKN